MLKKVSVISILATALLLVGCSAPKPQSSRTFENNVDRKGLDFTKFAMDNADPRLCQEACDKNDRCVAWTYVKPNTIQGPKAMCWLKDRVPKASRNGNCISGLK
ncbi:PAN domain-containing protein [Sulfurimonas sp.]|uniref:PAN domain-containing protein n=1 Tax=Sulfurimonas sp. TaxID=2022749 RepID=UPI003D0B0539